MHYFNKKKACTYNIIDINLLKRTHHAVVNHEKEWLLIDRLTEALPQLTELGYDGTIFHEQLIRG